MASAPAVELRGVSRRFGPPGTPPTLHPTDLTLHRGEFTAVIGRSGSGKTTMLSVIGLLDRPDDGEVLVDGVPTASLGDRARSIIRGRQIGFVFQAFHLRTPRTAAENVNASLRYRGVERRERRRLALAALEVVDLADRADDPVSQFSGGERQRVALARAMATRPALICADEPTGNLDRRSRDRVLACLGAAVEAGSALLVVTHDPDVADRAQRVVTIDDGVVREER